LAQRLGIACIPINGFEAAGHIGDRDITNLIHLRRAAQSLSVPIVASGGFADGQGLASALAFYARGTNMATRFKYAVERPIHPSIKDSITKFTECDTELLMRNGNSTYRVFKKAVAKKARSMQQPGFVFQNVQHLSRLRWSCGLGGLAGGALM
jgi:NAD(P)H-dependent flavin oxidoreductase YrpB (nitropropane dioxygenase family)